MSVLGLSSAGVLGESGTEIKIYSVPIQGVIYNDSLEGQIIDETIQGEFKND